MQSPLESQIAAALQLKQAAAIPTTAQLIIAGVVAAAPAGQIPSAPSPIPVIPSGADSALTSAQNAFSLQQAASVEATATILGTAISVVAPVVPPSGLPALISSLQSALSQGEGASPDQVAQEMASAVIQYYQAGGVV